MATRMKQRRGTAAEWAAENPILEDGELGFERDTKIIKLGDGITAWNDLEFAYLAKTGGIMTGPLTLIVPTDPDHAARKVDVDNLATSAQNADAALAAEIDAHETLANPHAATPLATADRLVLRDSAGRASFADPTDVGDAATKGYVDETAVLNSLVDAAGDLLVGSAADVVGRLPKGSEGDSLTIADGVVGWRTLQTSSVEPALYYMGVY